MPNAARTIDVSSWIDGRRLGAFNYGVIALSWLITLFDGFDMMMIGFTGPYMRDQLHLSKVMFGNDVSSGTLGPQDAWKYTASELAR